MINELRFTGALAAPDTSELPRRDAVLDEAHRGDIVGALGTIRLDDTAPRRTWGARLLTLLAIMGPGLIVMLGDNDAGGVATAGTTATGLAHHLGPPAGAGFAIVLLNASLIGAAAVTLSTTYAFGDVFGMKHSLHRSWNDARGFYGIYAGLVLLAAGIVLIPNAPLGLITTAVQALAGILLPSATVFLLLCNDKAVLGPWVNRAWVNVLAGIIVGTLVELSLIPAAATLFPGIDITRVLVLLSGFLAVGLLITGALTPRRGWPVDAAVGGIASAGVVHNHPYRHDHPARLPADHRVADGDQDSATRRQALTRTCGGAIR
ncbi:MAG: divalent metal cation transporter, partial [Chloroflexota bacterium]